MTNKKKVIIPIAAVLAAALLVILFTPHEHTLKGAYRFYRVGESSVSELHYGDSAEEHFDKTDIELDINFKGNFFYTNIEGNINYLNHDLDIIDNVNDQVGNKNRKIVATMTKDRNFLYLSNDYKGAVLNDFARNKIYVAVFEDEQPTVGEIVKMFERCFP